MLQGKEEHLDNANVPVPIYEATPVQRKETNGATNISRRFIFNKADF